MALNLNVANDKIKLNQQKQKTFKLKPYQY